MCKYCIKVVPLMPPSFFCLADRTWDLDNLILISTHL